MGHHTVVLVRHGEYVSEPAQRLTDRGRAQAELLAARLHGAREGVGGVVSSSQPRAIETAAVVARALGRRRVPRRPDLCEVVPSASRWESGGARGVRVSDDGPTRVEQVVAKYLAPAARGDRCDVLVCHGNLIRAVVATALEIPLGVWWDLDIHHCGITTLRVLPDGRRRLVGFNDVGHLPAALHTM